MLPIRLATPPATVCKKQIDQCNIKIYPPIFYGYKFQPIRLPATTIFHFLNLKIHNTTIDKFRIMNRHLPPDFKPRIIQSLKSRTNSLLLLIKRKRAAEAALFIQIIPFYNLMTFLDCFHSPITAWRMYSPFDRLPMDK